MQSMRFPPLPADTARAAEAAFGRDHPHLKIGRELDAVLADFELPAPVSRDAMLADTFGLFSLASVLQSWEDLTDHQLVDAVRNRLDLKYALHLPLDFPGFESLALCSFRRRVLANPAGKEAFQELVNRLKVFAGDQKKRQADAEQIITALCLLSRAEIIVETMGNALEAVAAYDPHWLLSNALPHWYKLYYQKPGPQQIPRETQEIETLLQTIGKDGQHLLETFAGSTANGSRQLPEIQSLRREWERQFQSEAGELTFLPLRCHDCLD